MESILEIVKLVILGGFIPWLGNVLRGYLTSKRRLADAERIAIVARAIVESIIARYPDKEWLELVERAITALREQFPRLSVAQAMRIVDAAATTKK